MDKNRHFTFTIELLTKRITPGGRIKMWKNVSSSLKKESSIRFLNIFAAMISKLKQKWQINGWQLLLVICTFALGGSLCGYVGRKVMDFIPVDHPVLWTITYILVVTLVWPLCVLLISIPLGQFSFFKKYLHKLGSRIFGKKKSNTSPTDSNFDKV
jgi:hypothetical protein